MCICVGMRPTAEKSSLLTILVVAPPESVFGMDSSADVDLEGRFLAPFIVCSGFFFVNFQFFMEIDQSPRFTRRVTSFQTVVLSLYGLADPFSLPSAHFCHVFCFNPSRLHRVCITVLFFKKKDKG